MATNDHWIHQGRQEHGWFGHGSGPGDDPGQETRDAGSGGLFVRHSVGERIDYVAHSVVGHLARSDRWHVAAAFDGRALDRLRTVAVVWAGAAGLSRDEFRERLLDPGTGDATVDRLRRAARGMVAARGHEALAEAGKDLSDAARQIGLERWPRFVADAETRAMAAVSRGDAPGVLKASAITGEVAGDIRVGGLVLTYLLHRFGPSGARTSPPVLAGPPPSPDASIMYADVPLPPPREGETTADVLKPNGRLVGRPGRGNGVRELPGGQAAAQELYDRLTKGGRDITPPRFPGKKIELPNGDRIGYRPSSTSDPLTLDIEVKGVSSKKINFWRSRLKSVKHLFTEEAKDLYIHSQDDYVGLWQISGRMKRSFVSDKEILDNSLDIIQSLLKKGLEVGNLNPDGGFSPWPDQDPDHVIRRIREEWLALGHLPSIDDICWFNLPGRPPYTSP